MPPLDLISDHDQNVSSVIPEPIAAETNSSVDNETLLSGSAPVTTAASSTDDDMVLPWLDSFLTEDWTFGESFIEGVNVNDASGIDPIVGDEEDAELVLSDSTATATRASIGPSSKETPLGNSAPSPTTYTCHHCEATFPTKSLWK